LKPNRRARSLSRHHHRSCPSSACGRLSALSPLACLPNTAERSFTLKRRGDGNGFGRRRDWRGLCGSGRSAAAPSRPHVLIAPDTVKETLLAEARAVVSPFAHAEAQRQFGGPHRGPSTLTCRLWAPLEVTDADIPSLFALSRGQSTSLLALPYNRRANPLGRIPATERERR
jgi:hypothetical protein